MSNDIFNRALSNFTHDVASGGAVRHLADEGYTVPEIAKMLDFPTPVERIAKTVYEHYLNKGIILQDAPNQAKHKEVHYEKVQDAYGKVSFKRVEAEAYEESREYIECSFGKEKYNDIAKYKSKLEKLEPRDREYIDNLPWPITTVYHVADSRMKRIIDNWN
ncbi:MAG: hypothetical protein IKX99_03210 [Lachnospiraceae bacterium]|nr:hypothetical protein [Lachnospiraceae bacterium]MBR5789097.1 hypothetical protein [Lachnospiraceae bacterium]